MHERTGQRIYPMFEQPDGWLEATIPHINKENPIPLIKNMNICASDAEWKSLTGLDPQDTQLTIIVPIHNEAHALPSFLGALVKSTLPTSGDIQIFFITNGCTDNSENIITDYLGEFNYVSGINDLTLTPDTDINTFLAKKKNGILRASASLNNIRVHHINGKNIGKSYAQNLGNEIARASKHPYVISIDANTWVEPNTIAKLYKEIVTASPDTVLIEATPEYRIRTKKRGVTLPQQLQKKDVFAANTTIQTIRGFCTAWRTDWIEEIGGIPQLANEDYAVSILAHIHEKKVQTSPDAHGWVYQPNSIKGRLQRNSRHTRGGLQTLDFLRQNAEKSNIPKIFLEVYQRVIDDRYDLKPFAGRLQFLLNQAQTLPKSQFPVLLIKFLMWEVAIFMAHREYDQNPTNPSWTPIDSTK